MASDELEPTDGGGRAHERNGRPAGRRGLLGGEGPRAERRRRALGEAMLIASGELGYREAGIGDVLARSGGNRLGFRHLFKDKEDCYAWAYQRELEELCARLLAAGAAAESWPRGIGAAMLALAGFVEAQPTLAKGLLVEVHAVGGLVLARRADAIERLARAVDAIRRDPRVPHCPPPITAEFIVRASEEAAVGALSRDEPRRFRHALPALTHLAVAPYFGDEVGRDAARAVESS